MCIHKTAVQADAWFPRSSVGAEPYLQKTITQAGGSVGELD
jgi:hypothetical protein